MIVSYLSSVLITRNNISEMHGSFLYFKTKHTCVTLCYTFRGTIVFWLILLDMETVAPPVSLIFRS